MRYSGSKTRFIKEISKIILEGIRPYQCYVEPFMGGANSLSYIDHPLKIGADSNEYVVELWEDIKNNTFEIPFKLTEEEYYSIKHDYLNKTNIYSKSLIGYVGNACSHGSAWWNGYAHFNPNKNNGKGEDHIAEAASGLTKHIKDFKFLKQTLFVHSSYDELIIPPRSIIYCDPPYSNTKGYKDSFDSEKFWNWCRKMSLNNHKLFISEYTAPEDFQCIWEKNKQGGNTERLFIYK